ncbi:MAG: Spy/CpxP family protein refolding chaperone [Mariniphaga sp.]|jgi:Spy/CpxP family protein refolding chaperone|nr:Spy/CpxP family protein refolding chaperone [Mariniphaga sp.]
MKTNKFAFILIALMLGTTTVFAQGWRNANRPGRNIEPGTRMNILLDLTEEQQAKIEELRTAHLDAMTELRVKQRSTFDPIEKNEIRGEMLKKVKAHRNEVKSLLSEDQQKKFDVLQNAGFNRGGRVACRQGGQRGQAGYGGRGGRGYRGGW